MDKLYELREMLCDELDKITSKGELTAGSLETVDKLTHSIKSIDTIMAMDGGYSNDMRGNSYAQRRDSRSRYSRDNRMRYDGYSYDSDEVISKLHELMEDAPERERMAIRKAIKSIEK